MPVTLAIQRWGLGDKEFRLTQTLNNGRKLQIQRDVRHTNTHTHMCICTHVCVCVYTYMYVYIYIHVCV